MTSWVVCLHVFGSPEIPRNYAILKKLGRLPELEAHTVMEAPDGNLLGPQMLYRKFFGIEGDDLEKLNSQLIRNYLTNYEQPLLLTYIEGDYRIEQVRKMGAGDFLPEGIAVRARAMVKPDDFTKAAPYPVVIEYLFPTKESGAMRWFAEGDPLSVKKSPNCAAILHSEKLTDGDEPMVCLTVIPIAYGRYRVGEGKGFEIEPPVEVRPGAKFPVF